MKSRHTGLTSSGLNEATFILPGICLTSDLTEKLREVTRYIAPWKMSCYILVGFNSTIEQDLYRIQRCREFKVNPFVMPYRDYENQQKPSQYCKDLATWVNKPQIFGRVLDFADFKPRKGFVCAEYFNQEKQ